MPTYKELFGNEICKCGKRGRYIVPNSRGTKFECKECMEKREQEESRHSENK
jgi:hypothetical protein